MADMEVGASAVSVASWESSECRTDGVDGGHAVMGGVGGESLPPRKRLLVGLRQSGWRSSSSPLVSHGVEGFSREVGQEEEEDVAVDRGEGVVAVGGEQEEGYVASHGLESTGMRRIKQHGGVNCSTEARVAVSASSAVVEFFNPSFKKPRMSRERPKLEDKDRADASKRELYRQTRDGRQGTRIPVPVKQGSQRMAVPLSSHDAVAAAQAAAAQAVKLALAAKENAAAKASVAVKAAAAAKVALEAAAHAARAAALAHAGLQRKAAGSEPGLAKSSAKPQVIVQTGSHREKISPRAEVKVEKEDNQAGCGEAVSPDNEESAWELDRPINSSPQISHCLTSPVREVSLAVPAENSAELPFDAMVEADAVATHPISDIHDRRPDFLQEILEAAVLADSTMSIDEGADVSVHEEILQSEHDADAGLQENHSFSDMQVETEEGESRSDARLFDEAPLVPTGPQLLLHNVGESSAAVQDVGITNADTHLETSGASDMVNAHDAVMTSKDSSEVGHSDHEDMALKVSGAAEIMDAYDAAMALKDSGAAELVHPDDTNMALMDSGAAELVHPDDINMALMDSGAAEMVVAANTDMDLKCSQLAEVVGLEDAETALKGSGTAEVVCADDADTGLKDSGTANMVQVNLSSRVAPIEGLEAGSEPLLVAQEDFVVKASLEENAPVDG